VRATALVLVMAHMSRCSKSGTSCQPRRECQLIRKLTPCQLKNSLSTSQRDFRPWISATPGTAGVENGLQDRALPQMG